MDRRRRFVPGSDMLESRQLLSAAPATAPVAQINVTTSTTPTGQAAATKTTTPPTAVVSELTMTTQAPATNTITLTPIQGNDPQAAFEQSINGTRQNRIAQLPNYLFLVNTQRKLNPKTVKALQADLELISNRLHAPPQGQVWQFMSSLRDTLTLQTISPNNASVLSAEFATLLRSSGASPAVTAKFQKDMDTLIQEDVNAPNPAQTAANDYAIMVQYVLSVGRRIVPNATVAAAKPKTTINSLFGSAFR